MPETNFPLFVDPRVGSKELVKYLKMPVEVTELRYGDVAFAGYGPDDQILSIGIERKGIRDLANSIISGRLSGHQLIGLLEWYHVVYIVVDGVWRVKDNTVEVAENHGWRPLSGKSRPGKTFGYREIANYLNSLSVITGVKLWFTSGIDLTAEWIRYTYFWWQKPYHEHKSHLNFSQGPAMPKHAVLARPTVEQKMLKELPGVGWDRAGNLVRQFPTMEDIMSATPEDLILVEGIGKVLAKQIHERLHRK
jgi:ERCC4-type nuclease